MTKAGWRGYLNFPIFAEEGLKQQILFNSYYTVHEGGTNGLSNYGGAMVYNYLPFAGQA